MNKYMKKSMIIIMLVTLLLGLSISAAAASGGSYYKVHYGDTLYSIGRYYGVSAYAIAEANGLYNPNHIYAGQVLHIPDYGYGNDGGYGHDGGYGNDYNNRYHKVRYGETLFSIGRQYWVNPYAIARANGLYNPNHIYAGQKLYIPENSGYGYGNYGQDKGYGHNYY